MALIQMFIDHSGKHCINLNSAVESTTSPDCTDLQGYFEDFLSHRMGDTISIKNLQNNLVNQCIQDSRYDSTAEFRIKGILADREFVGKDWFGCLLKEKAWQTSH